MPSYGTLRNIIQLFSIDQIIYFMITMIKKIFKEQCYTKIRLCNDYELNVISATLNALLDKNRR